MTSRKKLILPALLFAVIAVISPGCLNKAATITDRSGDRFGSVVSNGVNRTYLIHIPPNYDKTRSVPLLVCLHGGGGAGKDMVKLTLGGFNLLADKEGFIVVYPDGIEKKWNDGRDERFSQADDVGFIAELIKELTRTWNIDSTRVYATGISNGAHMCARLARELSGQITAIAPVAYSMPEKFASLLVSAKPISTLVMTGTMDPLVPWEGGATADLGGARMLGEILSVPETIKVFVAHNQCDLTPVIAWEPDKDTEDGTRVRREEYKGGSQGTEVVLYTIAGGGHTWPGGWQYLPAGTVGNTCRDINASEVIWNFFQKHSR